MRHLRFFILLFAVSSLLFPFPSEAFAAVGDITEVATLEHDTANGSSNSLVKIEADTYALAYAGAGNDGFISTFTISADGSTITEVATLEHDTVLGKHNSLVKVDADTYALAYAGAGGDGFISTFTISAAGDITAVKTHSEGNNLEYDDVHDGVLRGINSLVQVDADTYALAYTADDNDGFISTFTISADGSTITEVATLEHDTRLVQSNSLVQVDADTYALVYTNSGGDGFIATFTISAAGDITAVKTYSEGNVLERTGKGGGGYNSLVQVDADTYALAHQAPGISGFISTFTISADGSTITEVATLEHDTDRGSHHSLIKADNDTYVLAYTGVSPYTGFIATFTISAAGDITAVRTQSLGNNLEHDTGPLPTLENSLVQVDADTYALAYQGSGGPGFISTFSISPPTTPSKIGTVTPTPGNTQVALSWSAPDTGGATITDYIPQYSTDDSNWSTFSDGTSTSTSATVTSLTNGTLYYFKVAAVNSVGTGTYSDSVSATPVTTPSQVGTVTPTPGNTQVALSWSAPATGGAAITDYIPQYSTDNSNWSTFSDGTSTSTSATVTSLTNGTLYYFKVAAVNSVGTGTYSGSVSATPATTPSKIGTVTPTPGNTQVALSWSAPATGGAAITDYIPQYSTDNSNWSTFSDGTSTSTSATVTSLTNGTLYYFKVAAVNSAGTGTYSDSVSATPVTTPSQVGTVTPTPGNTQVALSWSAPATGGATITDYIPQYSTDNSNWSTFSDGTSTSTSATVTSLTNGTLYYFKVAAVNSVGTGTYSGSVSATPATTPSKVTSCTSNAFTNQAQLSWSAPATGGAAITDYIPQYSTDNSNWSTFSDGTSTSTSVTVTGLTNGVLYYFKVAAVNSAGTGTYCTSTSVTVDEYSTDFKWFPAGGSIGAGTTGECANFTAGTQTFGTGVIFDLKNGIPDGQVWEHAGTFNQFMRVVGANDFTAVTQTFETGTSFGIDTTFNDGQTLPQYTITSSGVLLEEITCGTDTSSNTCIPNDVAKYLSPGEFLTTGIDTTETYSCISSNDKSFTIDGMGVTMSFDTITTSGDVKLDYYDPANVPAATANADGSVSISLASASGTSTETIGSIIDLSLETAAVTGDITITLPYLEANIPSGSTESDLVVLHYVNDAWKTEDNCTIDTTNNQITCTISSLSPFGIGIPTPNTITTSASGGCSKHTLLGNCGTISINNDVYRIAKNWNNFPTTEVLVGDPVTITLSIPKKSTYTKISSVSVYTEIFDSPENYEQGTQISYSPSSDNYNVSKAKLFQVAGATHRIIQDPDVMNLDRFEVVFTMIFAKPMDTSHIVIETKNSSGFPEIVYLTNALKVSERPVYALTLEEQSKFELTYKPEIEPESDVKLEISREVNLFLESLEIEPEPDVKREIEPEPKGICGKGTVLKDNMCVPKEWSFFDFFEQLMKLFG